MTTAAENHDVPSVQGVMMNLPPLTEETVARDVDAARGYLQRADEVRTQITRAISQSTQQTEARTQRVEDARATHDAATINHVLEEVRLAQAHELAQLGDAIAPLVIPFGQNYWSGLSPLSLVAAFIAATKTDLDGARRMADALEDSGSQFENFRIALLEWRNSVNASEAASLEVFRNRQHCLYAVDALLAESRSIRSLMFDVATALRDAAK